MSRHFKLGRSSRKDEVECTLKAEIIRKAEFQAIGKACKLYSDLIQAQRREPKLHLIALESQQKAPQFLHPWRRNRDTIHMDEWVNKTKFDRMYFRSHNDLHADAMNSLQYAVFTAYFGQYMYAS